MPGLFDALPVVFAQNAPAAGGGANPNGQLLTFLPYLAIIGLWFYLLLVRPQQKQEKQRRAMLDAMKKNDRVLTSAGIYGTVLSVDPTQDRVVVRIDDERGVKVAFTKASIVRILDAAERESDKEKEKEKAKGTA